MHFVIWLLIDLHIFGGPEPLKTSKAIDLTCQNIEYSWTRRVGPTSHVLLAQPQQTLEKAGFKIAWKGIDYRTMSSKAYLSGVIWTVRTPQARDKPAHRSHQAPGIGKHDVFEGPGTLTLQNT